MTAHNAGGATGIDLDDQIIQVIKEQHMPILPDRMLYESDAKLIGFAKAILARCAPQPSADRAPADGASIDTPEFQRLAEYWRGEPYGTRSFENAWAELIAHIDSRTPTAGDSTIPQPGVDEVVIAGHTIKHVEGHGWIVNEPNGKRWVAHEGTPIADFVAALTRRAPPADGAVIDYGTPTAATASARLDLSDYTSPAVYANSTGRVAQAQAGAEDARDAARYRWLRNESAFVHGDVPTVFRADYPAEPDWYRMLNGDDMDNAIDVAMAASATSNGGDK